MPTKGYAVLGWIAWQVASRFAKFKMRQSKVKLGAAATVLAVLVAGLAGGGSATPSEDGS
jgi:hypothetical protein